MVVKYCASKKDNWDMVLDGCIFAYNTLCHESALYTPFEIMFGRKATLPIDLKMEQKAMVVKEMMVLKEMMVFKVMMVLERMVLKETVVKEMRVLKEILVLKVMMVLGMMVTEMMVLEMMVLKEIYEEMMV
eukprot:Em0007g833a